MFGELWLWGVELRKKRERLGVWVGFVEGWEVEAARAVVLLALLGALSLTLRTAPILLPLNRIARIGAVRRIALRMGLRLMLLRASPHLPRFITKLVFQRLGSAPFGT